MLTHLHTGAEEHVLAAAILHGVIPPDLTPQHFADPANHRIWAAILRLPVRTAEALAADFGQALPEIGGWPRLLQITDESRYPTSAHAAHFADILRRQHLQRRLAHAQSLIADRGTDDPEAVRAEILAQLATEPQTDTQKGRPLFSFTIPDAKDPSIILGNRYINQGDGAVLSSTSGMGKSAMALQMATRWSLELDAFGIKPSRALRILIVQSEDSDGDVAEVTASIAHVMQLTSGQIAQINENVLVVTDRVNRGTKFLHQLKLHIASHRPDLVIINPLQAFVDGDITASKDLGAFLREGLNGLNEPAKFAYLLIHHTTKPATGKERAERQWHEVMYDMAGGAEIINWARAILSLRATPTEGEFNLVLAKRGRRAGVTKQVQQGVGFRLEPVTTIALKHAHGHLPSGQPLIYWEARDSQDAPQEPAKPRGRDEKYKFDDYRNLFPPVSSNGLVLNELHRALLPNGEIQRKMLHQVCARWAEQGRVEIIDLPGQPRRYRTAL